MRRQVKGLVGQAGGPLLYMIDGPSPVSDPGTRTRCRTAGDADRGRDRRLRYAVFVRHHRAAERHQEAFETMPIDVPNPSCAALRDDVRHGADSIYLSPAPLYHAAPCASR